MNTEVQGLGRVDDGVLVTTGAGSSVFDRVCLTVPLLPRLLEMVGEVPDRVRDADRVASQSMPST